MSAPTLKVVHLVDEGAYLVERTWGQTLEVDGMPAPQGDFVVKSLDSIRRVVTAPREVIAHKSKAGETMLPAEYLEKRGALLLGSWTEDDGETIFPNLDAEFAYRKFKDQWTIAEWSEPVVTREPVECVITEVRVQSGDPDIVSLWNAPSAGDARLYSLDRDGVMLLAARQQCEAAGLTFTNDKFEHLQFGKIEGAYAFDATFNASRRPFIGTLAQCQEEKAACIDRVTRVVQLQAAKKRGVTLRNTAHVIGSLEEVAGMLAGVTTTGKSANGFAKAKARLREIVHGLRGEISAN